MFLGFKYKELCVVVVAVWISPFYVSASNNSTYTNHEIELYDQLFASYRSSLRPIAAVNVFQQTVINVIYGLMQIESLNERDQKFTSHGYIMMYWHDNLLMWDPAQYGGMYQLIVPAEDVWLPEISPINSVVGATELASLKQQTRVRLLYDGIVTWIPALKWQTSCNMDVGDFPYDTQHCEIHYTNWMYGISLLNFTAVLDTVDITSLIENLEWHVIGTKLWVEETGGDPNLPIIKVRISMKRDPKFFELNVLLPSMLLSFLMIPMFILPAESGEKISLGVTLMLAYSIFLLMMTDVTPRSGNTPKLTVVILVSTVFSGMATLLNVFVINLHFHRPEKPVPCCIKRLILGKLARVLGFTQYGDENEVQKIDIRNDEHGVMNGKGDLGKDFSNNNLSQLNQYQAYFKGRKMEADLISQNGDDWNSLARVMDRLLMIVYSVYFTCNFIGVLTIKFS